MNVVEFLASLAKLDIRLWLEGENLRFNAPDGAFTPDIRDKVVANKAQIIAFLKQAQRVNESAIDVVPRDQPLVVSYGQQRLWVLDQINPRDVTYNMCSAFRIRGALRVDVLSQVFTELVKRHESLRTCFAEDDGTPFQVVQPAQQWALQFEDLSAQENATSLVNRALNQESLTPYDLSKGPLFRATLLKVSEQEYVLVAGMHHIISDGWSMEVLSRELAVLYMAFSAGMPSPLPPLSIQYADFSAWQVGHMSSEEMSNQLEYWQEQLHDAPPVLDIPTDRPRQEFLSNNGALLTLPLSGSTAQELINACKRLDVTPFMYCLGAWQLLLSRFANTCDVVVGAPIAGRSRSEVQELIGFFVNMLLLRLDLTGNPTVSELYARVKSTTLGAFSHQDIPIDRVLDEMQFERQPGYSPLAQAGFQLQNIEVAENNPLQDAPITIEPVPLQHVSARMDVILGVSKQGEHFELNLEYNTDLFDESTMNSLLEQYAYLLQQMVTSDDAPIETLALFDDDQLLRKMGFDAAHHALLPLTTDQLALFEHFKGCLAIHHDFTDKPDLGILEQAVQQVVNQYHMLRLTLSACELPVAQPVYGVIPDTVHQPLHYATVQDQSSYDLAHQKTVKAQTADLISLCAPELKRPLIQFHLLSDSMQYRLLIVCHPMCLDQHSLQLTMDKVLAVYDALRMNHAPALDADYDSSQTLFWSQNHLDQADALNYWQEHAQALDALSNSLPLIAAESPWIVESVQMDHRQVATIEEFCQAQKIELADYFQLLIGLLLKMYCRPESGFVMYNVSSVRDERWKNAIGCFYRSQPTVVPSALIEPGASLSLWCDWLRHAKEPAYLGNVALSLKLQQSIFPQGLFRFEYGFDLPFVDQCTKDSVRFSVRKAADQLSLELSYDAAVFSSSQFLQRLLHISEQLLFDDIDSFSTLNYLSTAEQMQLMQWGAGPNENRYEPVIQRFERMANQYADKTALIFGACALSYQQVNEQANRLAHYLCGLGIGNQSRVALCLDRSSDLVISILAILKTNASYVPFDPAYPKERRLFMLADSNASVLITHTVWGEVFSATDAQCIALDQLSAKLNEYSALNPEHSVDADQPIYTIYTSGSTGQPKGAVVTQGGESNLQNWYIDSLSLTDKDRTLLISAVGFDLTQKNLFAPLLVGGALVIPEMDVYDDQLLLSLIEQHQISWVNCAPSAFYPLVEQSAESEYQPLKSLRYVVLGGEPIRLSAMYPWLQQAQCHARIINSYGPTECADVVAYHVAHKIDGPQMSLPIGKPIANTQLHIVNNDLQPVLPQAVGEICVTGQGVGLGYIQQEALTAKAFVDNPFGAGKLYKTGDLGRFLENGDIEYIGRKDFQIKLRGLRIELGEIEYALKMLNGVDDGLVLVSDETLIAYVISPDGISPDHWRESMRDHLPEYMIPSVLIALKQWPLTPNGKIDRKALPDPTVATLADRVYIAPRNSAEQQIADIWQEVLQVSQVGVTDNLFEIGGNSLLATRIVSRMKKQLNVALSVRDVFVAPTIDQLAQKLTRQQQVGALPDMVAGDYSQPLPLSFAQQRLWFLDQLDPENTAYNMPGAFWLKGLLDAEALLASLHEIVERHAVLRSTISEHNDQPVQHINAVSEKAFTYTDWRSLPEDHCLHQVKRRIAKLHQHVFDLHQGPLFYAELIQTTDDCYALLINMHHIVSDGWSNGILMHELGVLYDAFSHDRPSPLAPLRIQYADYARWQKSWLQGAELERQVSYWREALGGVEVLNLPTNRKRDLQTGFTGSKVAFEIPANLTAQLNRFSRQQGASLYMTTLAAYMVLLSKYTHQDDIAVGSPVANRHFTDIEPLIGFFVNTLVLRGDLTANQTFSQVCQQIRQKTLDAYAHQDIPFERLVDEVVTHRDMLHSPLFQVMFALQNVGLNTEFELPGVHFESCESTSTVAKFDIEFSLMEHQSKIIGEVVYRNALFDPDFIKGLIHHYLIILEKVVAEPEIPLNEISIVTDSEKQRLHRWNSTTRDYDREVSVHQLFERQVDRTPHNTALIFGDQAMSYIELDKYSNQVATMLGERGVKPGDVVGVMLPRSLDLMAAILAVLKAGATYLPLDPAYPRERLEYMLDDSSADFVISYSQFDEILSSVKTTALRLDHDKDAISVISDKRLEIDTNSEQLLYVIYTSGSTGKPKGTGAKHRAEVNLLSWYCREFAITENDRVMLMSAIGFDLTQKNLFAPLISGAALVIPPFDEYDPEALVALIEQHRVSWINCAPNAFYPLVESAINTADLVSLRWVFLGGEPIDMDRLIDWLDQSRATLVNSYGPTECADIAAAQIVNPPEDYRHKNIPIGSAIDNVKLYVVDDQLKLVPEGVPGELCIGGEGVGPGYFNDRDQTAEKFIVNPFGDHRGNIYRTGDLVRLLADGSVEYLGRIDNQVKIRGYRIELGEIEAQLRTLDTVVASCVIARDMPNGAKDLVAYLVSNDPSPTVESIRQHLKTVLPEFMIPAYFVHLDQLPLTPNGKVARNLLPEPDLAQADKTIVAPTTDVEKTVLSIWSSVLGNAAISLHDDFFAVGGNSLLATQVVSRIRQQFGIKLPLRALFESPTLFNTAQLIEATLANGDEALLPTIEAVDRSGALPLSMVQQQLWLLDQLDPGTPAYNMPVALRITGALDSVAFETAFQRVIQRHETLRTNFDIQNGEPVAIIKTDSDWHLEFIDLSTLDAVQKNNELKRLQQRQTESGFDLKNDPLVRGTLLDLGVNAAGQPVHVFAGAMHHIVSDGWSLNIIMAELLRFYQGELEHQPVVLPPLDIQYVDYAAWQRAWLQGEVLDQHIAYWRKQLNNDGQVLNMPTDFPRPAVMTTAGDSVSLRLPSAVIQAARGFAQDENATLFMLLMAVYQTLLARYSGQSHINVGTPIAGRESVETEALVGFFINTVVISSDIKNSISARQLLRNVRETTLSAYSHQALPFEKIIEALRPARDTSRTPFFQVFLNLLNLPPQSSTESGLLVESLLGEDSHAHSKYDFNLYASELADDSLEMVMVYNSDLYRKETVLRFMQDFTLLFEGVVSNPDAKLNAVSTWQKEDQTWKPNLSESISVTGSHSPLLKFLHHAETQPDTLAIRCADASITYGELELRSRQVAKALAEKGVQAGDVVAVLANRSPDLIISLLGVLRQGAIFTVLDSSYPVERLSLILSIANPVLLLDGLAEFEESFTDIATLKVSDCINKNASDWGVGQHQHNPANPAYIAFTSGTTGVPKGVVGSFEPVSHFIEWYTKQYELSHQDVFSMLSGLAHDPLLRDVFVPLSLGASIAIPDGDWMLDPNGLLHWVNAQKITTLHLTPSMAELLTNSATDQELNSVRWFGLGGDRLVLNVVNKLQALAPHAQVINFYGATETPQVMSAYTVPTNSDTLSECMPLGSGIDAVQLLVLDSNKQLCAPGIVGEIVVRTPYLAIGYLNDESNDRFINNPYRDDAQDRLYCTGDKGRYRLDGMVEFVGRVDDQVKIRGYRIEPAEIESAIRAQIGGAMAVVVLAKDPRGDDCLVAYIQQSDQPDQIVESLKQQLRQTLPSYMVPSLVIPLQKIPLTANGKVNKRELPSPHDFWVAKKYVAPRTEYEHAIAAIWQEVMKNDQISVVENFFDAGGHSLLAVQIVTRVKDQYNVEFSMRRLLEVATIEGMAAYVENALWLREPENTQSDLDDDDFEELEI